MSSTIGVVDDVGETVNVLRIGIGPLQGYFDMNLALVAIFRTENMDDFVVNLVLLLVHLGDIFLQTTLVGVVDFNRIFTAKVAQNDLQASIEEGGAAHSGVDHLEIELDDIAEDAEIWFERDFRARRIGLPAGLQFRVRDSESVFLMPDSSFPMNNQFQPLGDGVHRADSDSVKAPGNLVCLIIEFSASVKFGHYDLSSTDAFLFVDSDWNASAVIGDADRAIGIQVDFNRRIVTSEVLVDSIVDDLPDTVVESRTIMRVSKVHPRSLSHCFEAFEDLDTGNSILFTHRFHHPFSEGSLKEPSGCPRIS